MGKIDEDNLRFLKNYFVEVSSHISKLTLGRYYILAPVMIVLIFFATFNINRDWYDFIGLLGFGLIGITFKAFGWSRPALLIGFFLLIQALIVCLQHSNSQASSKT